jgi:hypothetical protein
MNLQEASSSSGCIVVSAGHKDKAHAAPHCFRTATNRAILCKQSATKQHKLDRRGLRSDVTSSPGVHAYLYLGRSGPYLLGPLCWPLLGVLGQLPKAPDPL